MRNFSTDIPIDIKLNLKCSITSIIIQSLDYYTTAGDTVCGGLGGQTEPLFSYKVLPIEGYNASPGVDHYPAGAQVHLDTAGDVSNTPTLNQVV